MKERWRPVVGYEGIYSVSSLGRVRRELSRTCAKAGTILKPAKRNGYLFVQLCRDGERVNASIHQIVAQAFLGPPPPGHGVNHKNLDRADPRLRNLEYLTQSGNMKHAYANGARDARGEGNGQAKLKVEDVIAIRAVRRQDRPPSYASLARHYGVSDSTIRGAANGRTWNHV